MKLKKMSVLLLTILLFFTMSGFFSNWRAQKNIKKGDEEAEKGNYSRAFTYYEKAEEKGFEPTKNLHAKLADKKLEKNDYEGALYYLLWDAEEYFTKEEAVDYVMETVTERFEEIKKEIENDIAEAEKGNEVSTAYNTGRIDSILSFMEEEIIPRFSYDKEFLNDLYTQAGLNRLYNFHPTYKEDRWYEILKYWNNCETGIGYEVTQAVNCLKENKFAEAEKVFENVLPNQEAANSLVDGYITQEKWQSSQREYESLDDILAHMRLLYRTKETPAAATLQEAIQNADELEIGVSYVDYSIELTDSMVQQLKQTCGTSPNGKVLFLHIRTPYSTYRNIMNQFMMALPEEYFPESLEEVEYVFVLTSTSSPTGRKYMSGTKQIQEKTVLTVYDMKTGKTIYTGQNLGPLSNTMYYSGRVPSTYSAGAPDMQDILLKACEKIS